MYEGVDEDALRHLKFWHVDMILAQDILKSLQCPTLRSKQVAIHQDVADPVPSSGFIPG